MVETCRSALYVKTVAIFSDKLVYAYQLHVLPFDMFNSLCASEILQRGLQTIIERDSVDDLRFAS